jgi:hypothetical protein
VFGLISGATGTLLGLAAAFLAGQSLAQPPAYGSVAWFSGLYFAAVGWVRGPDAGFLVGEVLRVVWAGAQAELGRPHPSERSEQQDQPVAWRSTGLLLAWVGVVLLLAWRS